MKVLAINGSPRLVGNTSNALSDLLDELEKNGIETEHLQIYENHFSPCNDCRSCQMRRDGRCIIEDDNVNEIAEKMAEADGIILASPSYFGSCTGQMKILLERVGLPAYVGDHKLRGKVGVALAIQGHDGGSTVHSELVGFMLRNEMIVCGSKSIGVLTGKDNVDYQGDKDGMTALNDTAEMMVWLLQKLAE